MVKCDCCFEYDRYHYGVTGSYPEVKKHHTALMKSGRYGTMWKDLLNGDAELHVNAELRLYQCPCCHQIYDEFCLDLYKSIHEDDSYYVPTDDEIVHQYKHICKNCMKKMTYIPISQKHCNIGIDNPEELVICPKCGGVAVARFCGFTD